MADIDENFQTFLAAVSAVSSAGATVGQEMPETADDPYVYYVQSGERRDGSLCDAVEATQFDVEVYSADIEQCRDITNGIKAAVVALQDWPVGFGGVVQFGTCTNHDDSYIRKLPFLDGYEHVGNLFIELYQ